MNFITMSMDQQLFVSIGIVRKHDEDSLNYQFLTHVLAEVLLSRSNPNFQSITQNSKLSARFDCSDMTTRMWEQSVMKTNKTEKTGENRSETEIMLKNDRNRVRITKRKSWKASLCWLWYIEDGWKSDLVLLQLRLYIILTDIDNRYFLFFLWWHIF